MLKHPRSDGDGDEESRSNKRLRIEGGMASSSGKRHREDDSEENKQLVEEKGKKPTEPSKYSIIIQIHISFNPFKWIYLKSKSIFLDFKSSPFNWIWIRYRLDTFLDYPNCILGWILTWLDPG